MALRQFNPVTASMRGTVLIDRGRMQFRPAPTA